MKLLILSGLILSSTAWSKCTHKLDSIEDGPYLRMMGLEAEEPAGNSLESCVRLAQEKLGSFVWMDSLLRIGDYRYVTDVTYKYSDNQLTSEGKLSLKNRRRN